MEGLKYELNPAAYDALQFDTEVGNAPCAGVGTPGQEVHNITGRSARFGFGAIRAGRRRAWHRRCQCRLHTGQWFPTR